MQIRLLGPVDVVGPDAGAGLSGRRRAAVLAALALARGDVVSVDRLVDAVWAEDPPATAATTVQSHVSYLRRLLGAPGAIRSRPPGYVLDVPADQVDLDVVRALLARARTTAAPDERCRLLRSASATWRGAALEDLTDLPYFAAHAARLEELQAAVLEELVEAELAAGRHRELVPQVTELVERHPFRERLHHALILALYRSDRQSDALAAYDRARRLLRDELGLEPGPALQQLAQQVLRQDATLAAPSTPTAPPAPASVAAVAAGAPAAAAQVAAAAPAGAPLIGREEDRAALVRALLQARVVSVVGIGGTGKTRLVADVARDPAAVSGRPVVTVDLTAVQVATPDAVTAVVAAAAGVTPEPDVPLVRTVGAALSGRTALVVLDNCEHVLDAAADVVTDLLAAAPDLGVLTTSREPLQVAGEAVLRLLPLAVPADDGPPPDGGDPDDDALLQVPAVRLLVTRARLADSGFRLTSRNRSAVAALCRHLDGLPLALELAGARLRTLTPEELVERLDDRFRVLTSSARDLPARHRSLRAVLDSSYALLSEEEGVLFRHLGVFDGHAGLAEVGRVCAPDDVDALDRLERLIDRSLVVRREIEGQTRILLHETVRSYARELLDGSGEADAVRDRLVDVVVDLVRRESGRFHRRDEAAAIARLRLDATTVRTALGWACAHDRVDALTLVTALWWFWFRAGRVAEGRDWVARALAAPGPRVAELERLARCGGAYLAWLDDDFEGAERESAAVAADADAAIGTRALAQGVLARAVGDQGRFDEAATAAAASVELYRAADDAWGQTWSRRCLASAVLYGGDPAGARELAERCLREFDRLGDSWGAAGTLDTLSSAAHRSGDDDLARRFAAESVTRHRAEHDLYGTRYALQHLAEAALAVGDTAAAQAAATESLTLCRAHGYRVGTAQALLLLADLARSGDPERARTLAAEAAALGRALGDVGLSARADALLAGP